MGVEPNLHSPSTRRGPETTGDVCGELASMIYARLMVNFEVKLTLHDFNTLLIIAADNYVKCVADTGRHKRHFV